MEDKKLSILEGKGLLEFIKQKAQISMLHTKITLDDLCADLYGFVIHY